MLELKQQTVHTPSQSTRRQTDKNDVFCDDGNRNREKAQIQQAKRREKKKSTNHFCASLFRFALLAIRTKTKPHRPTDRTAEKEVATTTTMSRINTQINRYRIVVVSRIPLSFTLQAQQRRPKYTDTHTGTHIFRMGISFLDVVVLNKRNDNTVVVCASSTM